jgi:hypothetical protein
LKGKGDVGMAHDDVNDSVAHDISNSVTSDIVKIVENNELTLAEMTGQQFLQLIKLSSMQAAQYIYDKNAIFEKLRTDKVKQSQFDFHFPFILTDTAVSRLNVLVKERIASLPDVNIGNINFTAQIDFQDDNSLDFIGIDDLLAVVSESLPKSIVLRWRYYQVIYFEHNGIKDEFQIPYDITITFRVRMNNNVRRELIFFEEYGNITVEGLEYDWINRTLQLLKTSVKSTKMPPWWFLPKYIQIKLRPFLAMFVWAVFANSLTFIFIDIFGIKRWYHYIMTFGLAYGTAAVIYALSIKFWEYFLPPSMISLGDYAIRHNKIVLTIYSFVYVTVILSGILIPILISKL